MTDFTLPELGENISAGDVLRVLVKPGDTIEKEQAVLELETDKATIEVPSSVAGRVKEVKVKAGDKVKVGQAILSVEDGAIPKVDEVTPKAEGGPKRHPAEEKVPDVPLDVRARDQSTRPDNAGVKDPSVGPQAQSGADDEVPARRKNVVDISRGARAAEPAAAPAAAP